MLKRIQEKESEKLLLVFAQLLAAEMHEQEIPVDALQGLTRPEGRPLLKRMVQVVKRDRDSRAGAANEARFKVFVDPGAFDSRRRLIAPHRFEQDETCFNLSNQVGERDFLIKFFMQSMSRTGVKRWASENGYRVATLEEADALIQAHPELLPGRDLVAHGSFYRGGRGRHRAGSGLHIPVLERGNSLFGFLYKSQFNPRTWFVFVRL